MGFQDKDSVTVDSILTKEGRKILSQYGSIKVKYAKVSDAQIDYRLWNPDHPKGSAYYGEAIESMPLTEANSHSGLNMLKDSLVTFARHATHIPVITNVSNISFGKRIRSETITPDLHPTQAHGNWLMLVTDGQYVEVASSGKNSGVTAVTDYNELLKLHLSWEGVTSPKAWRFSDSITIEPAQVDASQNLQYLIVEENTGLYASATISMEANEPISTIEIDDNPVG